MSLSAQSSSRNLALSLIAVMAFELLARLTGVEVFRWVAWGCTGLVVLGARRRLGLREGYLLTLCVALVAVAVTIHPAPVSVLASALDQASFLMAFILLLGLLHEAASTSPSVAACGEYLTRQPPGRRYYALNAGTAAMAVLFNIGVVSFLVPLIQRGIETATPGDPLNPVRERRQISAMLRGFAWCVVWSPTAIAPLALVELIPGTNRQLWILLGLALFAGVMFLGALEDMWRFRSYRPAIVRQAPLFPTGAYLRFAMACVWLFAMTGAVAWLAGDTIIFGLMVSCPVMLVGWIVAQQGGAGPAERRAALSRLSGIAFENLPKAAPVAVTLACSGFVGRAAAALIPAQSVAAVLGLDAMPDFVLLSILPVALSVFSLLALSPIMMAVFFGSLFGSLPVMPADPTLIALSISCGWAVSMTFSPFATVVLMTNRVGGIPGRTLTWGWNLGFSVAAALALVPVFWILTGGQ